MDGQKPVFLFVDIIKSLIPRSIASMGPLGTVSSCDIVRFLYRPILGFLINFWTFGLVLFWALGCSLTRRFEVIMKRTWRATPKTQTTIFSTIIRVFTLNLDAIYDSLLRKSKLFKVTNDIRTR